jgi:tetratricopeptide (TPR) repeat protein
MPQGYCKNYSSIFMPVNQNLDYDYPISHSFFTPPVYLSFLFLALILSTTICLLHRARQSAECTRQEVQGKKESAGTVPSAPPTMLFVYYRLIAFGIFWFFITLSVKSSVIPIADVIFKHRVYLPSIGLFIAITTVVFVLANRLRVEKIILPTFVLAVLILSGATYTRNTVWKDETSLWEDVAKKSPNKARPHNNLGFAYASKGLIDMAIAEFQTALRLEPHYTVAHYNLGVIYYSKGLIDMAIEQYQTALRLKPDYTKAHNNLGNAYQSKGLIDMAIAEFQTALRLEPHYAVVHYNLGNAYQSKGLIDMAIEQYQTALRLKPDYTKAHYNLGVIYYSKGLIDMAIEQYQKALRLKPDYVEAHNNLGVIYTKKGLKKEAIREFEEALEIRPNFIEARQALESLTR